MSLRAEQQLLLFQCQEEFPVLKQMIAVMEEEDHVRWYKMVHELLVNLMEFAEKQSIQGNLWKKYIIWMCMRYENAYTLSVERSKNIKQQHQSLYEAAVYDFNIIYKIYNYDLISQKTNERAQFVENGYLRWIIQFESQAMLQESSLLYIRNEVEKLQERFNKAKNGNDMLDAMNCYYEICGVGDLGMFRAFSWQEDHRKKQMTPIHNTSIQQLKDLIGYDAQKKLLAENTEQFLQGYAANNVLLYGDSGTGKSSCVKALLNEYGSRGLRMVEVYKHQFRELPKMIEQMRKRRYGFIIFMDDLSFEDFEIEYKYLKALIEGGLETKPNNVLIYATSNRRHLIRENWKDREEQREDVHGSDTKEEKLSLSARFGLSIMYIHPDQEIYLEIVQALASKHGIPIPEAELKEKALVWELRYGGRSGRTAEHFIQSLGIQYR